MSSKCLLFPIFIHKVDIENCCVNNSKVAINVPFLITNPVYCCVIFGETYKILLTAVKENMPCFSNISFARINLAARP